MAQSVSNRIEELKSSLSRLSPRDWLALSALAMTVVLGAAVIVGYVIYSGLEELEQQNAAMRKALSDLQQYGSDYMVQRERIAALEMRMSRTPLELNTYVEKAAKEAGVTIAESKEVNPVEGERYQQRGLEISLRKVNIEKLGKLLKVLESGQHIVQVTRLNVSSRWGEHEDLDVEMVVSTFDPIREKENKEEKPKSKRRGRS